MITCQHARLLFGRYLDGELSPSLQAELHAHQLTCADCQSELALLEACGDVIALDRCEPALSASFTDRVLLAHRAQRARPPHRRHRMLFLVGSPMAAAASILLAMMVILPSVQSNGPTVVGGVSKAVPEDVEAFLQQNSDAERSAAAKDELNRTPRMAAGNFASAVFAPMFRQAVRKWSGARNDAEELKLLLSEFADTNKKLVAQWRSAEGEGSLSGSTSEDSSPDAPDWFAPNRPPLEPADEATTDPPEPL